MRLCILPRPTFNDTKETPCEGECVSFFHVVASTCIFVHPLVTQSLPFL